VCSPPSAEMRFFDDDGATLVGIEAVKPDEASTGRA
jgi:hypothetical protein